jgi:hypothetical protein
VPTSNLSAIFPEIKAWHITLNIISIKFSEVNCFARYSKEEFIIKKPKTQRRKREKEKIKIQLAKTM